VFSYTDILWFVFSYRQFVVCVLIQTFCGLCFHIGILWFVFSYTDFCALRSHIDFCGLRSHIQTCFALCSYTQMFSGTLFGTKCMSQKYPTDSKIFVTKSHCFYPRTHQLIRQLNTTQTLRSPRKFTEIPFIKRKLSRATQTSANNSRGPTDTLKPTKI